MKISKIRQHSGIFIFLLGLSIVALLIYDSTQTNLLLKSKRYMNLEPVDLSNNIFAPLFVSLIIAIISAVAGWLWSTTKANKKIEAAPKRYVQELDTLIVNALKQGEANAIVNARAIVATRNSLRNSLVTLSSNLNSEIDRLAFDIGEISQVPKGPSEPIESHLQIDPKVAFETIIVLSKIWPAKKVQIEVEIRKMLAELGLTPE